MVPSWLIGRPIRSTVVGVASITAAAASRSPTAGGSDPLPAAPATTRPTPLDEPNAAAPRRQAAAPPQPTAHPRPQPDRPRPPPPLIRPRIGGSRPGTGYCPTPPGHTPTTPRTANPTGAPDLPARPTP